MNDQGEIVGEALTNALKAKINSLARNCEPGISLKNIQQVGGVLVITIDESSEKPHSCSAGYYRRLDAATQKMNQKELKFLFDKYGVQSIFEELINGVLGIFPRTPISLVVDTKPVSWLYPYVDQC